MEKTITLDDNQYIAEFTYGLLLEKEDVKKVQELLNAIRKIYGFRRKTNLFKIDVIK